MTKGILIVGAGGHARVVAETLVASGERVIGFIDTDATKWGAELEGIPVVGGEDILLRETPHNVRLANGIGSVASTRHRREVFVRLQARGYAFVSVIHPAAYISPSALNAEGVQIMAGALIQTNARLGRNALINTGAVVDHDSVVGEHCHVAPRAVLSGEVTIGDGTHVGTGASIIQGMQIGTNVFIAAGAVVVGSIASDRRVAGVPARELKG